MRRRTIEKERLNRVAIQFEASLGVEREEEIHRIRAENDDIFFPGLYTLSKYRLADAFVPDFITFRPTLAIENNPGGFVMFIEIEKADYPLFTNGGDPSSKLTHAVRQVQNWKTWVTANRDYFTRELEKRLQNFGPFDEHEENTLRYGFRERYSVLIGRRSTLRIEDRILLAQMNEDLNNISIMTYDMLLDRIVDASRDHGGYGWHSNWLE